VGAQTALPRSPGDGARTAGLSGCKRPERHRTDHETQGQRHLLRKPSPASFTGALVAHTTTCQTTHLIPPSRYGWTLLERRRRGKELWTASPGNRGVGRESSHPARQGEYPRALRPVKEQLED
jgi:hypothetical protein